MAVKIAGGSNVCLSGCIFIMKYARIMTLAPFERLKVAITVCGVTPPHALEL